MKKSTSKRKGEKMRKIKQCVSTHGGAGYSYGDTLTIYRYKNEPTINVRAKFTCGFCGYRGEAHPTGRKIHYYSFMENPIKWLKNEEKFTEPTWPRWMLTDYKYIKKP